MRARVCVFACVCARMCVHVHMCVRVCVCLCMLVHVRESHHEVPVHVHSHNPPTDANMDVSVCSANCNGYPELCAEYDVTVYPTVILFEGPKQWRPHKGVLNPEQIVAALKRTQVGCSFDSCTVEGA